MAMNWIKDNIEEFGGDPEDITLMGESAGANSVALHMVSPLSCKLFNKAILQSTGLKTTWGYTSPEVAEERSSNCNWIFSLTNYCIVLIFRKTC